MNTDYIQPMLNGLKRCISTAYDHESQFLKRFLPSEVDAELAGVYMASVSTKVFVVKNGHLIVEDAISTDQFIEWVESTLKKNHENQIPTKCL